MAYIIVIIIFIIIKYGIKENISDVESKKTNLENNFIENPKKSTYNCNDSNFEIKEKSCELVKTIDGSKEIKEIENMLFDTFMKLKKDYDNKDLFLSSLETDNIKEKLDNEVFNVKNDFFDTAYNNAKEKVKNIIFKEEKKEMEKKLNEFFKGQTLNIDVVDIDLFNIEEIQVIFTVTNTSLKRICLEFSNIMLITPDGEELEFIEWVKGYNLQEKTISSNNFRTGSIIFYYDKDIDDLEDSLSGSKLIINVSDVTNGIKYDLIYKFNAYKNWTFLTGNIEDTEKKISNASLIKEIKNNIQRIESFEEKLGISLENISVNIDKTLFNLNVNGEIIRTTSDVKKTSFGINIVYYNSDNEIIDSDSHWFSDFNGYDVFQFTLYDEDDVKQVRKIRLFVKE